MLNSENITYLINKANEHLKAEALGKIMQFCGGGGIHRDDMSYLTPLYSKLMDMWIEFEIVKKVPDTEYIQYELLDDGLKKIYGRTVLSGLPNENTH